MRAPDPDPRQRRFMLEWQDVIEKWAYRFALQFGASRADTDDLAQAAFVSAWNEYLTWPESAHHPETEFDVAHAKAKIGRAIKDAFMVAWTNLRGEARDAHQRGGGKLATMLRHALSEIAPHPDADYARSRVAAQANHVLVTQLLQLNHSHVGQVHPETRMMREQMRERLEFALECLPLELRTLIDGVYFEDRSFREVGLELGITDHATLWRRHKKALRLMQKHVVEFASDLKGSRIGGTLDDEPAGGSFR